MVNESILRVFQSVTPKNQKTVCMVRACIFIFHKSNSDAYPSPKDIDRSFLHSLTHFLILALLLMTTENP